MEPKRDKSLCAQFCDCLNVVVTNIKKKGQDFIKDNNFGDGVEGAQEANAGNAGHQEFDNETGADSEREQRKSDS